MVATLIALFTAAAALQLISWFLIGTGLRRTGVSTGPSNQSMPHVSVVVAVRDGSSEIPGLLVSLRDQTYHNFEIIVVDDHSTDATSELLSTDAGKNPDVRVVSNRGRGKKEALATGIDAASNDLFAFTDVDCRPESRWLETIARHHAESDECIVVGFAPYSARPGLLNRLVRYETLHTALLMLTAIRMGRPYMATGRSLSYRRSTFERVGGFKATADLLSGDDDLFVQAAAAEGVPVRFMDEPDSFVYSEAPSRFIDWIRQKRRHLSAGRRYCRSTQIALTVYHVSAFLCWVAPFALAWPGVGVLLARLVPGQIVLSRGSSALNEPHSDAAFAPLDLLFHVYLLVVAPFAWVRAPREW